MKRRQSNPPKTPRASWPEAMTSLKLGWRPKRLRDLQNCWEKWWRRMSLFRSTGRGSSCRWLNSIGTFSGSLQETFLRIDDQAMLWADPHVT